jgi:Flp pilus assembly protein TadG
MADLPSRLAACATPGARGSRAVRRPQVGVRGRPRTPAPRSSERGAVTAETVTVLPVLAVAALALTWLLSLTVTQLRLVDAAREVARAAARDDSSAAALALGRRVAPDGSRIRVARGDGDVVVTVATDVRGPGGLFGFLPSVPLDAQAVAASEGS